MGWSGSISLERADWIAPRNAGLAPFFTRHPERTRRTLGTDRRSLNGGSLPDALEADLRFETHSQQIIKPKQFYKEMLMSISQVGSQVARSYAPTDGSRRAEGGVASPAPLPKVDRLDSFEFSIGAQSAGLAEAPISPERAEKLAGLKARIADDSYFSDEKLDKVVDGLLRDLNLQG
jgi:hypothetical protein